MKMGTIASPWRYEVAAADAIRPDHQRRTAILRYASWRLSSRFRGWSGYPSIAARSTGRGNGAMGQDRRGVNASGCSHPVVGRNGCDVAAWVQCGSWHVLNNAHGETRKGRSGREAYAAGNGAGRTQSLLPLMTRPRLR